MSTVEEKLDLLIRKVDRIEEKLFISTNGESILSQLSLLKQAMIRDERQDYDMGKRRFAIIMAGLGFMFSILGGLLTTLLLSTLGKI